MVRICEREIRKRAEHNEGMVSTLEEVALHQLNIEKIEALGQLCPHLKILYLQNNLISKIQNLHKLKELEYLNLAVNNVSKVQNLQRCEALAKLDLTINFIPKAGLPTLASLASNLHLKELTLMGNPCTDWHGYRQLVVAWLPQLKRLDGKDITHSERIAAKQVVGELEAALRAELQAEGIDPDGWAAVEDDSLYLEGEGPQETGTMGEDGQLRRPWCPATRILEHREMERQNREAEERKKAGSKGDPFAAPKQERHEDFPPLPADGHIYQKNEGKWDFSVEEADDGSAVLLQVSVGKYMDTSLIRADVQPTFVRLLIKGKLLQLVLPCEVKPDASSAQRSSATGALLLTMPKQDPAEAVNIAYLRVNADGSKGPCAAKPVASTTGRGAPAAVAGLAPAAVGNGASKAAAAGAKKGGASIYNIVKTPGRADDLMMKEVRRAVVQEAAADGNDEPPPL